MAQRRPDFSSWIGSLVKVCKVGGPADEPQINEPCQSASCNEVTFKHEGLDFPQWMSGLNGH